MNYLKILENLVGGDKFELYYATFNGKFVVYYNTVVYGYYCSFDAAFEDYISEIKEKSFLQLNSIIKGANQNDKKDK